MGNYYQAAQRSFNGGEVSPWMYGRADDQKYATSLAKCRNFIPTPQGPVENRPGFQFVCEAKSSETQARLISFVFSDSQTLVLELGEKYIRFHSQGSTLSKDGAPYEVETPYAARDVFEIHYCQNADILTFVHPNYPPMELRRYSLYDWRLTEVSFDPPCDAPAGLTGTYHCGDSAATDDQKKGYVISYKVTALIENEGYKRESEASAAFTITANIFLDPSYIALSWSPVTGATCYRVYKTYSGVYGYIGEVTTTQFTDTNIEADESITPPRYDDCFRQSKGISAATVTAAGSGYTLYDSGVADQKGTLSFTYKRTKTRTGEISHYKSATYQSSYLSDPSYPPYPTFSAAEYPPVWLEDYGGSGSGAEIEPIWELTQSRSQGYWSTSGDNGDSGPEYTSTTTLTLKGYKVVKRGNNYKRPQIKTRYVNNYGGTATTNWYGKATAEAALDIGTVSGGVQVIVSDATGSGAELQPVLDSDGSITSVTVVHGGTGYSSPTVTVIPDATDGGSGGAVTVSVDQVGDYPGAVSYYEQRRCFAGTRERPQYVWMTKPGTEYDMTFTLPSQSDNRVKFKISSQEISRIKHLIPLSYLMIMTPTTEYRTITSNDDAVTPSSIGVRAFSYSGSSDVTPVVVNNNAIYEAAQGGHVRELTYVYNMGGYISGDVSIRANHLFDGLTIKDMAYMKTPYPVVWCVSSDGSLLSLTYIPEQSVGAWAKHTTDGVFESCCTVQEDGYHALYCVILRDIGGVKKRYIERMANRLITDLKDAFFVDSGLTYSGDPVSAVSGLDHLEGKEVSILADGAVCPRQTVTDGTVQLDAPARLVTVGLPYESLLQTLPLVVEPQQGAARGRQFNSGNFWVQVYQSSSVFLGADEDSLAEVKQRTDESMGTAPRLISSTVKGRAYGDWNGTGQVVIAQENPLPLTVCSVVREAGVT